jgi:succinate dehydrogenase / fumarate reductase cytochrome b subunit
MRLPITAIVSILHRISGVILLFAAGILLWMLDASLSSAEGFADIKAMMATTVCQIIVWLILAALAYHAVAGIRHLFMDCGIGETLEGGRTGANIVFFAAVVLIILAGVWLW